MKLILAIAILVLIPFVAADDCNELCFGDNSCTEQECNSYNCQLCDPYTCSRTCEGNNRANGVTCNDNSQCESQHCSGGKRAVSYQKACCPKDSEWNYLKKACIDNSEVIIYQAEYSFELYLGNNEEESFEKIENLTYEEVLNLTGNYSCLPWEKEPYCELKCPECDYDEDGYTTIVEVRYYANPMNKEDKPFYRLFQEQCPDYFQPETTLLQVRYLFTMIDIWTLIASPENFPASQLGRFVGMFAGILTSMGEDAGTIKDIGKSLFTVGPGKVKQSFKLFTSPEEALEDFGYEVSDAGQLLKTIKEQAKEIIQSEKNTWYDNRSVSARDTWDFDEECNMVILTKTYTAYYAPGYVGIQIAMFAIPGGQVTALSELAAIARMGLKVTKAAKLFSKTDWLAWINKLPDEEIKKISNKLVKLSEKYKEETIQKVAQTDIGKKVLKTWDNPDTQKFVEFVKDSPRIAENSDIIFTKYGDYVVKRFAKSKYGKKIFKDWTDDNIDLLARIVSDAPNAMDNVDYLFETYGEEIVKHLINSPIGKDILSQWDFDELDKLNELIEDNQELMEQIKQIEDVDSLKTFVMEGDYEQILTLLET